MLQPFYMSVDFKQKLQIREPIVTQYDDLIFVVTVNDNGTPAVIDGLTYRFVSRRPDNKSYYVTGVKSGDNEITFDLGKTEVSLIGKVNAAVQLFDSNNQRLSSFTFNYTVTEDISLSEELTSQELTLLEYVVQEGPGLVDYFTQAKPLVEQFTDYVDDLNQKAKQTDLDTQKSRIDNMSTLTNGSTTGDAELSDGRVGGNGITYTNIGTAIRTQIGSLNKSLTTMDAMVNLTTGDTSSTVGTTMTFGTQSYWIRTYISVNASEQYQVTTSFSTSTRPYVMFTNESLTIIGTDFNGSGTQVNENVKTVRVPSGATRMYVLSYLYSLNGRIIKVETQDLQTQIGTNSNIIRMGNLSASTSNATLTNITSKGATLTLGNAVTSQGIFTSSTPINIGDFMFVRIKLKSDRDTIVHLITYGTSSSMDYEYNYRLKAGIDYEIYIRTFNFTAAGTLHFVIQSDDVNSSGQVITISDLMIIKNSYDAWYDLPTKQTLKDFTKREITVDVNGGGQFYDINPALIFAKRAFDVDNIPVTIKVKNGYYLQYPTNSFPYAPINKGSNKISIIGESRDGVVIECYNTGTTQSKVIDIGGECIIENLTVRSLNDGTYNMGNDLIHNCYCIHNDTPPNVAPTKQYKTVVKNCLLYSACHSPIGAGLKDKQIQRYENCEFVSNGIISLGALYVHASTEATATNMGVEIVNCSCVSLDGTKAITLPNTTTTGALTYVDIPVTIQKTIGYTTGAKLTDDNFKATHKLQPQSALNNVTDWNY